MGLFLLLLSPCSTPGWSQIVRALPIGEVGHLASTLCIRVTQVSCRLLPGAQIPSGGVFTWHRLLHPKCPRQPAGVSLCVGNRAPGRHSEPMLVNGASERLSEDPLHPRTLESLIWYGWGRIQPSIPYPLVTDSLELRDLVALGTHS